MDKLLQIQFLAVSHFSVWYSCFFRSKLEAKCRKSAADKRPEADPQDRPRPQPPPPPPPEVEQFQAI
uniref:HDC17385 n=1 Tax=Drosophila melanogaster TaxID=7227 RepID=Q6IIP9_DROME|nr:TPA_inf: HDC17385 [Drosophila melanogaster]